MAGRRQGAWAADGSDRSRTALLSISAVAHEVRETTMAIAFISRFFMFVATILVKHQLRRLWLGITGKEVRHRHGDGTPVCTTR
jgi:hypothetical protein